MATRGKPPGLPRSGGRVKGSLDKGQRQLVSAELAHSILATFELLGGTVAMHEWALENQTIFYTQILSRLMPAPQKSEDFDVQINNTQLNFDTDPIACAQRVAFALSLGLHTLKERGLEPIDVTPVEPYSARPEPDTMPETYGPPELPDADQARWASELPLSPEERRDNQLVRQTTEVTLSNYRGGPGEQPGTGYRSAPASSRKPTVAEIARRRRGC